MAEDQETEKQEAGKIEEQEQGIKLVPDPENPEIKRGKLSFDVFADGNGVLYTNKNAAIAAERAAQESRA